VVVASRLNLRRAGGRIFVAPMNGAEDSDTFCRVFSACQLTILGRTLANMQRFVWGRIPPGRSSVLRRSQLFFGYSWATRLARMAPWWPSRNRKTGCSPQGAGGAFAGGTWRQSGCGSIARGRRGKKPYSLYLADFLFIPSRVTSSASIGSAPRRGRLLSFRNNV